MHATRRAASLAPLLVASAALILALVLLAVTSAGGSDRSGDIREQIADKPASPPPTARTQNTPVVSDTAPTTAPVATPEVNNATDLAKMAPDERREYLMSLTREERVALLKRFDRSGGGEPNEDAIEGRPPIEFEIPFLDLGALTPGSFRVDTVGFTNTSDQPLTVRTVYTGCDCTTAFITDDDGVIDPGETAELVIETEAGWTLTLRAVSINLAFNEYTSARTLTSKFRINNYVAASPENANGRNRTEGRIRLTAIDGKRFSVLSVNGAPPIYDDTDDFRPGKDDPRSQYTIRWDFRDMEMPPRWLIIETDHPNCRIFNLAAYSKQRDVSERRYYKGTMKGERAAYGLDYIAPGSTRELTVRYDNVEPGQTPTVNFETIDDMTCELVHTVRGDNNEVFVTFKVTLSEDFPLGTFQRPMEVRTRDSVNRLWFFGVCKDEISS